MTILKRFRLWQVFACLVLASNLAPASAEDVKESQPAPVFLAQWGQKGIEPGQFHFPIGIAVNAADEVYVTDNINNRVQKFDGNGKLLFHFVVLPNPGGIALDKDGIIYLCHFQASSANKEAGDHCVSVYSPEGRMLRQWGEKGIGEGQFDCPGGIAVSDDGTVYIADQTNHRVQVFDRLGTFLRQWGTYGNDLGQFGGKAGRSSRIGGPQFLAFDAVGNVWTTEAANCRIQVFTHDGKPVLAWGTSDDAPGGLGGEFVGFKDRKATLYGPIALCFDKDQNLWISAVSGRVQQFDRDGTFMRGLGEGQGTEPGRFYAPHGMAFDSKGRLYVVDAYNHRVQKFAVRDNAPEQ